MASQIAHEQQKRIEELEAKLNAVRNCQRYTMHNGAYTTDNPTGKWMKSADVYAAIKEQQT